MKHKRAPTALERDRLHPQHPLVEAGRRLEIRDGEHQMVEPIHLHGP
jgi:hypothetical protein